MGSFAQSWPVSLGISPIFSFVVVLGVLFISFEMIFLPYLSYDNWCFWEQMPLAP